MEQKEALDIVCRLKKASVQTRDFNMIEGLFQWGELNGKNYTFKQIKAIKRLKIKYKDDLGHPQ